MKAKAYHEGQLIAVAFSDEPTARYVFENEVEAFETYMALDRLFNPNPSQQEQASDASESKPKMLGAKAS